MKIISTLGILFISLFAFAQTDNDKVTSIRQVVQKINRGRFYFDGGRVVKSMLKGSTRCSGKPTNALAISYLDECTRFKKLFAKK
ncbi:MAG TPA: hypothetical protein VK588_00160 [Chitinophagaceae bacterium]|nr:hypothetical protein [Chitinophagaceae bacterium]